MNLRPIIVIAGPTASGKSSIAIQLAKAINGVIVNADSRQVYKELSIGTARPIESDIHKIPHYLYGYISVKDPFNLYQYQQDVFKILNTIPKEKTPIFVGGTGLYIDSVVFNYLLQKNDSKQKSKRSKLTNLPLAELQKLIPEKILDLLNNSEKNNPRRLIRLIEKENISFDKGESFPNKYFVLDIAHNTLRERIEKRVDQMIKDGLIEENRNLIKANLLQYPALNTIGYKEFNGYFENTKTLSEVKAEIITHTLQYAKRQRTWFKRNKEAMHTNDYAQILKESQNFLKNF